MEFLELVHQDSETKQIDTMKMKISLAIFFLIGIFAFTTERTVTGIVKDVSGSPIPGVTILIKGTNKGTQTDIDGKYAIKIVSGKEKLVFSSVGYQTQEVLVGVRKSINITLGDDGKTLSEVVLLADSHRIKMPAPNEPSAKKDRYDQKPAMAPIMVAGGYKMSVTSANGKNTPFGRSVVGELQEQGNTEDYSSIQENGFQEVKNNALTTFSIDVDRASYSNVRRFLTQGQMPYKDAVRIEEMINYFDYDYAQPKNEHPFSINTELSDSPFNKGLKLLHIGLQGKIIPNENLPASNLVFLIDVSGSMSSANKLPLLKQALGVLIEQLRPQDKVSMVVYAGAAGLVLPATSGRDKQKINEALNNLEAGGSTAGGAGIQLAYKVAVENFVKEGNNRVILASDGDFNVGASSDGELQKLIETKRESGVYLSILGFGLGNYKDNKMETLADKGNGNYAYIDNFQEAQKVFGKEFGGTLFTIAKDVKLQLEFNPGYIKGYRLIGYENRMLKNEDFHDDKKDAGELGSGHTVTAIYELIPAGIESAYLKKIDALKYQKTNENVGIAGNNEVVTIKLRYKKPDAEKSILLQEIVKDKHTEFNKTSNNFRFSAAVAGFGLILRQSEFKGTANYDDIMTLAKNAYGTDEEGYRAEFVRLVKTAKSLDKKEVGMKE